MHTHITATHPSLDSGDCFHQSVWANNQTTKTAKQLLSCFELVAACVPGLRAFHFYIALCGRHVHR